MVWPAIDYRGVDVRAGDGPGLPPAAEEAIRALSARYPTKQATLLPALHLAQDRIGHLPLKVLAQVAAILQITPTEVLDAASFYEMFRLKPTGRKLIQVCRGISCELCGQAGLLEALKKRLRVEEGQTTADGWFTLATVECLAACDKAPVVLVDDRLYEHVTSESIEEILEKEKGF